MYMPPSTRSENFDEAFALMEQNPFATLISPAASPDPGANISPGPGANISGEPVISHLPLVVVRGETPSSFTLIGHCARANPQWRHMTTGPTTVIFQGAHA